MLMSAAWNSAALAPFGMSRDVYPAKYNRKELAKPCDGGTKGFKKEKEGHIKYYAATRQGREGE